jgi:hypothetical protein
MSKQEYFNCQCNLPEHGLVFEIDDNDNLDPPDFTTVIYLSTYRRFWSRLWIAIKYIFGIKARYGHFDTFLIIPEDAYRLKNLIEDYIEKYNKWVRELKIKGE